jgi:hypothetical protein
VAAATRATLWAGLLNSHADCWRVKNAGQAVDMMFLGLVRGVGGLARVGGLLDDWNAYAELAWGAALGASISVLVSGAVI